MKKIISTIDMSYDIKLSDNVLSDSSRGMNATI